MVAGQRENTLGSFRAAVAAGLSWVEADARVNADGVLVSRHDPMTDDGRLVSELSTRETDEIGLLRVADLFEDLPPEVSVDLDVKTSLEDARRPREETTAALVAALVAREEGRRQVLVSSFDPSAVVIVRERAPRVPIGLLTWRRLPAAQGDRSRRAPRRTGGGTALRVAARGSARPRAGRAGERGSRGRAAGAHVVDAAGRHGALVAAGVDCLVVDNVPTAVRSR